MQASEVAAVALAGLLCGCGAGVSLVLKSPVASKCEEAGLHGCDDLADGVVDFVAGDKAAGTPKIKKGIAANDPDALRAFGEKLRLLKGIPGAAQYAGPLLEVADLLASPPTAGGEARPGLPVEVPSRSTAPPGVEGVSSASVVPAATGTLCTLASEAGVDMPPGEAICTALTAGPLIVHDVETLAACPNTLVVGAGSPTRPRWMLVAMPGAPLHVHGAAFAVRPGEHLFAAQLGNRMPDLRKDLSCLVTWSATR